MAFLNRGLVQVDKNGGVYFLEFVGCLNLVLTFILPRETDIGSAGEQPTRDSFGDQQKCQSKECFSCSPLIFSEDYMH